MTGKGGFTSAPQRRLQLILAAQIGWLGIVLLLGAWWGRLVLKQAGKIAELEQAAGLAHVHDHWVKTQRMLFWESATFFVLLIATTAALLWMYWRDFKRSRSLQAFFASVTHELRTPLTSIRLQAESIAENTPKEGSNEILVRRLLEDTLRLESQVERTLELARIEGGGPVYTQSLQIKPWIERTLKTWKESYGERVEIRSELEDLTVEADPAAVTMVIRNLLENSVRHSRKDPLSIQVRAEQVGDGVTLIFKDNGEGFKGNLDKLGDLFYKGPGSHGAGVGLYLVKVLMRRMGGDATFKGFSGFEAALRFKDGQDRPARKSHG